MDHLFKLFNTVLSLGPKKPQRKDLTEHNKLQIIMYSCLKQNSLLILNCRIGPLAPSCGTN